MCGSHLGKAPSPPGPLSPLWEREEQDKARMRFRSNGDWDAPLVIRTAYGGGLRGGPYHSQSVEAYYCHVPGLRVVAASL